MLVNDVPFSAGNINAVLEDPAVWAQFHAGIADPKEIIPLNKRGRYIRVQMVGLNEILSLAETTDPGVGGIDELRLGDGRDIALGGPMGDVILAGGDDDAQDIVLGDHGYADFELVEVELEPGGATEIQSKLVEVTTTDTDLGGKDVITTGFGPDVAIGGAERDVVAAQAPVAEDTDLVPLDDSAGGGCRRDRHSRVDVSGHHVPVFGKRSADDRARGVGVHGDGSVVTVDRQAVRCDTQVVASDHRVDGSRQPDRGPPIRGSSTAPGNGSRGPVRRRRPRA